MIINAVIVVVVVVIIVTVGIVSYSMSTALRDGFQSCELFSIFFLLFYLNSGL